MDKCKLLQSLDLQIERDSILQNSVCVVNPLNSHLATIKIFKYFSNMM